MNYFYKNIKNTTSDFESENSSFEATSQHKFPRIIKSITFLIMLFVFGISSAVTITSTGAGGDWGTAATWSPAQVPTAADDVIVASGSPVTSSTGTLACLSLTVNSGGVLTIWRAFTVSGTTNITGTINFASSSGTGRAMLFTGDVTLNSGAVWTEPATGNGATNTYSFAGNFINNATTFNALGTGTHTFSGASKEISGTTTTAIKSIVISGSITNSTTISVGTSLVVNSGATLQMGTGASTTTITGAGTFTLSSGATLGITSTSGITTTGALGNIQNSGTRTYSTGANYIYNGNANQAVGNGLTQNTPASVQINNTGNTVTLGAATTISGNLTIISGASINLGTGLIHKSLTLTLGGVSQPVNASYGGTGSSAGTINTTYFTAGTGVLNVALADTWTGATSTDWATATNWSYGTVPMATDDVVIPNVTNKPIIGAAAVSNSLTINTGATLTISGTNTLTVSGNWTNSGTFTANSSTLTVRGNWTNAGTFTANTSTVIFNNAAQTITGSTTFNNVTIAGTGAKTITTASFIVNGILSIEATGTLSAAPTYGAAATLQYNKTAAFTSGAEWITPFVATGGIVIAGTGAITMNANKIFNLNVPLTINLGATLTPSNRTLSLSGNFINNGTYTSGTGAVTITGTALVQSIGKFTTTAAVSMTKTAGVATFTGNVSGAGLTINGAGGTLNLGAGLTHTFSGTWARTAGTLNGGSSTINFSSTTASTVTSGVFTASTSTVNYSGVAQTVAPVIYNNLILSGTGAKTFPTGTTTVNGILSVENATNANVFTGTLTYGASATLQYNAGTSARTVSSEWPATFSGTGGVLIKGTGIITLNGAKVLGTNNNLPLNITSGAKLTTNNFGLTFHGDFVNAGTFTGGSSPIVITGTTATQSIATFTTTGAVSMTKTAGLATLTGAVSASALTINGSGGTLNLGTSLAHTFSGDVTLTAGTLDGGTSTTLNVTSSSAIAWNGDGTVFSPGTSTVVFGGIAQTLGATSPTFYNITFSGTSATKTISNAITVNNNLNINSSAVLSLATGTVSTTKVLQFATVAQAGGSWGNTASTAANTNNTYFAATTGTINASTAQRFVITGTATQTAGTSQTITITAANANGSTYTTYTGSHNLTFSGANSSTNPVTAPTVKNSSGTAIPFGSSTAITFTNGVATITSGMTLYKSESIYISVTDGTVLSAGSDRLQVTVAVGANSLSFSAQPSGGTTNVVWSTQPVISWQDNYGNMVTGTAKNITLSIGTNPASGTLGGTATVPLNTITGQATFSDLSINKPGTGYTLSASAPSLTTVTSNTFNITNLAPSLTSISPNTVCADGAGFTLTVIGTNFNESSIVSINGNARTTIYQNETELDVNLLASDIASGGTPTITVFNPIPGGGTSSGVTLTVSSISINPNVVQPTCYSDGNITLSPTGGVTPYNYDWADLSGTSNAQDRTGLQAGVYSITVTDANGCSASSNSNTLTAATGCSGISVCKSDTASVLSVAPDPDNTSYTWTVPAGAVINSGQGTPMVSINWSAVAVGGYPVTVVGNNVCGASSTSNMTVYVQQPSVTVTADLACSGGNLNLYASGGVSYSWSGPNGFASQSANPVLYAISGTQAGTYTVTATNASGCSASASVVVTVNATPSIVTSSFSNPTGGGTNGSITLTSVTNATSYSWSAQNNASFAATSQNLINLGSDSYTVNVTNASGCAVSKTFSLSDINISITSSTNVNCYGSATGAITQATPTGGAAPYTYSWNGTNGGVVPLGQETNLSLTDLVAGTYSVIVTDNNGLQGYSSVIITEPFELQADGVVTNVNCYGNATGAITLTVSGGTSAYTYSWSGPSGFSATTKDISTRGAGTYSLTITDNNGCTLDKTYTITQPSATISAVKTITNVNCYGNNTGQIVLTMTGGTSPYTYAWSGPSSFTATTKDITGRIAGSYSVTITDAKGCSLALTGGTAIVISQPTAALSASITSQTNVNCKGNATGAINITVAGGTSPYFYSWNNGATTEDLSNLSAGNYSITITDSNGCITSTSATITEPTNNLSASISSTNPTCFGSLSGSIDLTVTGGTQPYTYLWSNNGTTQDLSAIAAGNYSVLVTDNNGCSTRAEVILTDPTAISIAASVTNVLCNGASTGSLNLTVTGGTGNYTYDWNDIIGTSNSEDRTSLAAGQYEVTVYDENNCSATSTFTITESPVLQITNATKNVSCKNDSDGSISINVTGGAFPYLFSWTGSNNFSASTQNIDGIPAGTYSITVTDANSCSVTNSGIIISQPSTVLSVATTPTNISCLDGNNGTITSVVSGGTAPYTYAWSTGATTSSISNLFAGNCSLQVKDANGCSIYTTITLTQPTTKIELFATTKSASSCGGATGKIDLTVVNGVAPFSYSWTNTLQTVQDPENLAANTYTVTVTDSLGCTANLVVTISAATSLSVALTTYPKTCIYNDGSAYAIVSGGVPPYTYLWNNGAVTQDIGLLSSGNVTVSVTDSNGCVTSNSDSVGSISCTPPVAIDDVFSTDYNTPLTATVGSNDTDPDGNNATLQYFSDQLPTAAQGILTWGSDFDGSFTFTPTVGYAGTFTLTYFVFDVTGLKTVGHYTITVGPHAINDSFGTPLNTTLSETVVTNDIYEIGSTYTKVTNPSHGNVTFNSDGTFVYTPNTDYAGDDSFTYQVCLPSPNATICSSATVNLSVDGSANVQITKTVNTGTPNVGNNVIFTLTAINDGPNLALGVVVTDVLPSGYTYVSNTASVGSYDNTTGLWTVGSLLNTASATLNITATLNATGNYTNTASISSDSNDPNTGNNGASASTTPIPQSDILVEHSVNNPSQNVGSNVIFTLTVTNNGPSNATGVNLSDLLPSGFTYVSSNPTSGTYNPLTGEWNIGNLANGDSVVLTITAVVNVIGIYTNTATVSSTSEDPTSGNNTASQTVVPGAVSNLSVTKTMNNNAPYVGGIVEFTISATNHGPSTATNVSVIDALPTGYTYSYDNANGNYNTINGKWSIGSLNNNATATLVIGAIVNATGDYTNSATIASTDQPDENTDNNTSSVTPSSIVPQADLSITKSVNTTQQSVGSNVIFTLVVTNNGPSTASGISVTDLLPSGYTYVSNSTTTGSYVNGTGVWTIGTLNNGASASIDITASVNTTGNYLNVATINATTADLTSANNTSSKTITAVPVLVISNPSACGGGTANLTSSSVTQGSTSGLLFTYWIDANATIPYATPTTASAGTYYIKASLSDGGYTIAAVVVSTSFNVWTGAISSDWNNASNWACGVPAPGDNIQIPGSLTNYPTLDGPRNIGNLNIANGASINLNGSTLTASGPFTGTGTIIGGTNSGLAINGAGAVGTFYLNQSTPGTSNVLQNFTLNSTSSGSVTLGNTMGISGTLTLTNGTFNTGGNLTLQSNSNGTAVVAPITDCNTVSITGDVTVERFFPARRAFRFIASPITTSTTIRANWQEGVNNLVTAYSGNQNPNPHYGTHITGNMTGGGIYGFDATQTTNNSMFIYTNSTSSWSAVPNTNVITLNAGTPYRLMIRGDRSIDMNTNTPDPTDTTLRSKGTLALCDMPTVTLNQNVNGFSFIGNPYQATVDIQEVLLQNNNINPNYYWAWDPKINTRGGYVAFDLDLDVNPIVTSSINRYLQPWQACFIRNTSGGGTLTFHEENKSTSSVNENVYRLSNNPSLIKLNLFESNTLALQGQSADGVFVKFSSNYTNEIDQTDASKFANLDEMFSTKNNTTSLSIESRAIPVESDIIPLSVTQYRSTNYTIVAEGINMITIPAYLHDQWLQSYTEIPQTGSVNYSYSIDLVSPASQASDRFRIVFSNPFLSANNQEILPFVISPNPCNQGVFDVLMPYLPENAKLIIYNSLGQIVYTTYLTSAFNNHIIPNRPFASGVYYVKIIDGNKFNTNKLIIE